ncbi:G-protein coupled receptor 55 [Pithys albifrons albifrons]|uniref:G-protein coupled receptor 55 n=1 Tax=Pithys albifrons albifrons TaxID=3385563 RepID=UPI003A5CF7A5
MRTQKSTQWRKMTNSSGKCNFTAIDSLAKTLQLGISIPTFILGLILNILALSVFCCFWKKQTKTSIYMINLALADVLLLLSLPLKMYYSNTAAPGLLCSFIESLYFVNTYVSIFIIVFITVDRYMCIRNPFEGRANQSPRWAILICCLIWAIAWMCSIPMYVFHKKEPFTCFHNMSEQAWSVPLIVSLEVVGFLIPLVVVVFCSARNICILLNHKRQAIKKVEGSGSIKVIIINLVVFLLCFTPVHLAICLQCLVRHDVIVDCSQKQIISLFIQVSMILANLNCCLDAIFYYFAAKEFREKIHLKKVIEVCPVFKPCATVMGLAAAQEPLSPLPLASLNTTALSLTQQEGHPGHSRESTRGRKTMFFQ